MQGTLSHVTYDLSYHVVFVPKRRRKIFGGERSEYAERVFKQVAQKLEVRFDTLKVAVDHVHMLLCIPPKYSVSEVMQKLKGASAYLLLKQYPELRKELPDDTFWARGYYIRTVGSLNEQLVRNYIDRTDHL